MKIVVTLIFLFGVTGTLLCEQSANAPFRPATLEEFNRLFGLATYVKPERCLIIADVKLVEPAWNEQQIQDELKKQNEFLHDQEHTLVQDAAVAIQQTRSKMIAKAHSGERTMHVREWYSNQLYRLDQTDEATLTEAELQILTNGYHDTFVNIHDLSFSPYSVFSVNWALNDVLVNKSVERRYGGHQLWRGFGIDEPVALPILLMLVDPRSIATEAGLSEEQRMRGVKISQTKAEQLRDGLNANWHVRALDTQMDGVQAVLFEIDGTYRSPESPGVVSTIKVSCWIGKAGEKFAFMQASLTNMTQHTFFSSKRKEYDVHGLPKLWNTLSRRADNLSESREVSFEKVDLNPTFDDRKVFLPPSSKEYTISDVTSGQRVLLQNGHSNLKTAPPPTITLRGRRTALMLVCLAIAFAAPLVFVLLRKRTGNK